MTTAYVILVITALVFLLPEIKREIKFPIKFLDDQNDGKISYYDNENDAPPLILSTG